MTDAVVLWVDPSDEKWLSDYCQYSGNDKESILISNRFKDWDTLRYVFRSIDFNLPWIDKVHLVTCGHLPEWLNLDNDKVYTHKHADIFSNKLALPTFNSSAIELNLANIEGLSEKFIYFNDDFLVLRKTEQNRFFVDDKPVDFLRLDWPKDSALVRYKHRNSEWQSMILNNLKLINSHFKMSEVLNNGSGGEVKRNFKQTLLSKLRRIPGFEHYHQVQPYLKSSLREVDELFCLERNNTLLSKFRQHDNISQALYRYYHLCSGNYYERAYEDHKVFNLTTHDVIENIDFENYNLVCLNDSYSDDRFLESKEMLSKKLNAIFPIKSGFEK